MKKIDKQLLHEIFEQIKLENKEAYELLYKNYYEMIYGICFSMLKNKENSEDITQLVFTKILNMPKENLPSSCEATWVYTVTKNEVLQFLKKQNNNIDINDIYDFSISDEELESVIDMSAYYEMTKNLNEIEKEIVSLKVLCEFNFREIGIMLNMPTATVQWHYYKAIKSLKAIIGSVSSLIVAITITTIGINKNGVSNENEIISNKNNSKTETSQSDSLDSEYINPNMFSGSTETSNTSTNNENNNITLFSIAGIFLMISIIFTIFFKKSQQKLLKKSSK